MSASIGQPPAGGTAERWAWPAAILAVGLAVRLAYFTQICDVVFVESLVVDSRTYDAWARRIAGGEWIGRDVFYQAPLYPYFMAVLYVLRPDPWIVRIVQALLGALACVLLAGAGQRFFDPRVGRIAGFTLALYAPAIYFDGLIQKASLDCFLACAVLLLLSTAVNRPAVVRWLIAGGCLGLLALNRENALLLALVPLFWILAQRRASRGIRVRWAAALACGVIVLLMPSILHNSAVGRQFVLTTSQAGPNFYIGNRAGADGTYRPLRTGRGDTPFERRDAIEIAEAATGRRMSASEVSAFWFKKTWDDIRTDPAGWLRLLGWKFLLAFHSTELADAEDYYYYAQHAALLGHLGHVGHYGLLIPLAVLGATLERERRGRVVLLAAFVLVFAAGVALFFVFARYRHAMTPALILLAASAAVQITTALRSRQLQHLALPLAAALIAGAAVSWSTPYRQQQLAVCAANAGKALLDRGRLQDALGELAWATELDPQSISARVNFAVALLRAGRDQDAERQLSAATELAPDDPRVLLGRGIALTQLGRSREAISALERALETWPCDPHVLAALADALLSERSFPDASSAARRAIECAEQQGDPILAAKLREYFREKGAHPVLRPGIDRIWH